MNLLDNVTLNMVQVSEATGISIDTLRTMCDKNQLPYTLTAGSNPGKKSRRFRASDLELIVKAYEKHAASTPQLSSAVTQRKIADLTARLEAAETRIDRIIGELGLLEAGADGAVQFSINHSTNGAHA